jgi:hypothetical protein
MLRNLTTISEQDQFVYTTTGNLLCHVNEKLWIYGNGVKKTCLCCG